MLSNPGCVQLAIKNQGAFMRHNKLRPTAPHNTSTPLYRRLAATAFLLIACLCLLSNLAARGEAQSRSGDKQAGAGEDQAIPVEVTDMTITRVGVAITLSSDETQQELHLMIGPTEGQSIVRAMRHARVERPQTHDLMKTLLEKDGWQVTRVVINDLRNGTYYANIVMEKPGAQGAETRTVDARPSDAMALGLRFDAKIYVRQKVFDLERETLGPEPYTPDQPRQEEPGDPERLTI
jgi:bifunctional DNase/RNase